MMTQNVICVYIDIQTYSERERDSVFVSMCDCVMNLFVYNECIVLRVDGDIEMHED